MKTNERRWQIIVRNTYRVRGNVIDVNRGLWRYPRHLIREFANRGDCHV